jgi:hypothetical protein
VAFRALAKPHLALAALVVVVLVSAGAVFPSVVLAEQDAAASAIASAKQQIVTCLVAVRAAEAAGANISSLTFALSDAGALLSQSELAYSKGDYGAAESLASQCGQRLSGLISESNSLKNRAVGARDFDFLVSMVISVVGTFVVIVLGFVAWRFLTKRYVPVEVETDEPSEL